MSLSPTRLMTILGLIWLVLGCNPAPAPAPLPEEVETIPDEGDYTFVTIKVSEVELLADTSDWGWFKEAEFRLFMIASGENGESTGMFCPGEEPLPVNKGSKVQPCEFALSIEEEKAGDEIYVMIMGVDEDSSNFFVDYSSELAIGRLTKVVMDALKHVPKVKAATSGGGPLVVMGGALLLENLISYAAGKAKDWIEKRDILGIQGVLLCREDLLGAKLNEQEMAQ